MNQEKISRFIDSLTMPRVIGIIFVIGIAAAIFELGVFVGFHKAAYVFHWEQHLNRGFGEPGRGDALFFNAAVPNPHGAAGTVVSISLPTFVIAGNAESEKVIRIGTTTIIRQGFTATSSSALKKGEVAVVLGEPNEAGEIEAALIRILPQ
jgi:hypothetical protein